jgi:dinuclear metal center YbgI/SA1388 family protein
MAGRDEIVALLDQTLRTAEIKDSSCNGLQVEGTAEVRRVGLAVDACLEAYAKAVAADCQMLIVHHGLIWGGITSVTGRQYKHIRYLIEQGINLYASHLPLDMHNQYGNNIQLANLLRLRNIKPFGDYHGVLIGYQGVLDRPMKLTDIAGLLSGKLAGRPMAVRNGGEMVSSVGIVSGGAGDMIEQAAIAKLDCYITGEPVHYCYQLAREAGSNVIYLGHYHSEQLGVQALGKLLADKLGVESVFLETGAFTAGDYTD